MKYRRLSSSLSLKRLDYCNYNRNVIYSFQDRTESYRVVLSDMYMRRRSARNYATDLSELDAAAEAKSPLRTR